VIAWLTNAADPSPSAQVDVAQSTGGVDPDTRGIKMDMEPSGALRRTAVYRDLELVWDESAVSSVEKTDSISSTPEPYR